MDENLFGTAKKTNKENDAAVVNMAEIRKIRAKAEENKDPQSSVITRAELDRIRATTAIITKD